MESTVTDSKHSLDDKRLSKPVTSQTIEALKDIVFGSTAGIVGKYVEYPFDTVKVRLQSQPDHLPLQYQGPLDCFRQSIRRDGFFSLYRGISAPLVGAAVETSSLFFGYRIAQDFFRAFILEESKQELPISILIACGGISGAFTSLWLTPIELVKCQMQVPLGGNEKPGPLRTISAIYGRGGFRGFWHGQIGTLIRESGGTAAWFGAYEGVSAFFRMRHAKSRAPVSEHDGTLPTLPIYEQMTAGAAAGMSYNFLFYPADTIKSRMQTEEAIAVAGQKRSFWTVAKAISQQRGLRGFYQGCGITVGRAAPSSALIFTIYEALRKAFD